MEQLLLNYGSTGLLALFILYVLKEFKAFLVTVEERCEKRYADLFEEYKKLKRGG